MEDNMKLNRSQLRKMILQEMNHKTEIPAVPPHLQIDDAFEKQGEEATSFKTALDIVDSKVSEIEESRGGLDTHEAATDPNEGLIKQLADKTSFNVTEILAEMLLDAVLELRSLTRR